MKRVYQCFPNEVMCLVGEIRSASPNNRPILYEVYPCREGKTLPLGGVTQEGIIYQFLDSGSYRAGEVRNQLVFQCTPDDRIEPVGKVSGRNLYLFKQQGGKSIAGEVTGDACPEAAGAALLLLFVKLPAPANGSEAT